MPQAAISLVMLLRNKLNSAVQVWTPDKSSRSCNICSATVFKQNQRFASDNRGFCLQVCTKPYSLLIDLAFYVNEGKRRKNTEIFFQNKVNCRFDWVPFFLSVHFLRTYVVFSVLLRIFLKRYLTGVCEAGFTRSRFPVTACRSPVWIPLVYINTFT